MEKNLMSCKFCQNLFDCKERVPRMIFKCGHSICTSCLKIYLNSNKENFICPEDNKKIEIKDKNLDSFPQNYALVNIIQQKDNSEKKTFEENTFKNLNNKSFEEQSDSLISLNLGDLCIDHKKKLDIICLTCRKTICYQCALFENHKNHQVKQQNEFLQEFISVKNEIAQIKNNINEKKKILNLFDEKLSNLLNKNSINIDLRIEETFRVFIEKLKKQKESLFEEKKKCFANFKEMLRTKIKCSFDFENDINIWKNRINEIINSNKNDMNEAFNTITKVKKENLIKKGKSFIEKISDILENCEKNTEEFTTNLEIKETINLDQNLFELFSPEINLESLLLNFDLKESINFKTNFNFSKTDVRRYTENISNSKSPSRFKRKNLSLSGNNMLKKSDNTIQINLPEKDNDNSSLSKKERDISLYESFSFHRQSDIADLKNITGAIKESDLKKEDDLFNELTISDIPELDLNKLNPNDLNMMKNNDSKFNSVFNSINFKSLNNNILKSSSVSMIQNNPQFFTKQKNSLSKHIMSVKKSVIDMESPLKKSFSRNRLDSKQKENVVKKSKLKSRPTSSSNKSAKSIKKSPVSARKNSPVSKRSISTKRKKSRTLNKSKSQSKNNRYLKKIMDGPKGSYIKKLEKNLISNLDLTFLNLNNNHLGALCPMFKNSRILKILKLKGNQIGDKGLKALSDVLINSNINNLDLSFNSITKKGIIFLKNLCEKNPKLKTINLKKNKIDQKIRNNLITEFKMMSVNLKI